MVTKPGRKPILLSVFLLAAVAAGMLLFVLTRPAGSPDALRFNSRLPGAARAGYVHEDRQALDQLAARSRSLLLQDAGWIRSLRLEGRLSGQAAEPSSMLDARDQVAAARVALESGDKPALQAALARIRRVFRTEQGLMAATATIDSGGQPVRATGFSIVATLEWLRLLAESGDMLDQGEWLADLRAGSDAFLALTDADATVPADTPLAILKSPPRSDPAATPTPRPSVAPTPEIEGYRSVIRIADLDLYAMQLLQPLDPRWQAVYARSLALVRGAVLEGPTPLFQYAYDPSIQDYIGFAGSQPVVSLEDSLFALLHLHEAGEPLPETLTWVRSRFYESGMLAEQLSRVTGAAASESECVAGYALLARIARLAEDPMLYGRAMERLTWHAATNTRSAAYGMIFRTDPDERIRVTAHDNLWTLLAGR